MQFPLKLLIATSLICGSITKTCAKKINLKNPTLYNKIVDCFHRSELRNPKTETCQDVWRFTLPNKKCCDSEKTCRYYGTCCIDAFFNNETTSLGSYLDIFLSMTGIRKHVKNLPVINLEDYSVKVRVEKLPMVASCENKQSYDVDRCTRSDSKNDVRVIADGFVYKNKYCALCHGFTSYSQMTLELACSDIVVSSVGVQMTIPDETCTLEIDRKLINKKLSSSCLLPATKLVAEPHFRLLLSFDEYGNPVNSELDRGNPICLCGQYFDIFSNQCKDKLNYTCENNTMSYKNLTYLQETELQLSQSLKPTENGYQCLKTFGGVASLTQYHLKGKPSYVFLVPFQKIPYTQLYGFSPQYHFSHSRVCANPKIINQSFTITSDCNVNISGTILSINKDVTYWINVAGGNVAYAAARCNHFHLAPKCRTGVLNMSEVTLKKNSVVTVHINNEERTYEAEQYLPLPEGLRICLVNEKHTSREYAWLKQYDYFEILLSLTLLSFSVIFELLLLIVYLPRKRLRNIPKKNLIAFCLVLLVCDIIGLMLALTAKSLDQVACKTIAVLLHFFSLALCVWPAIIAYEYYKIFRCNNLLEQPNMLYLKYCAIGFGIPFIVTTVYVIIDILSKGSLIRYGSQDYCWIFPFYARLAIYIVPFSIMNFSSFVLVFIVTLQTKREKMKDHCMLTKAHQFKFSEILMKLCLLFGSAELIGLVQIPNAKQKGLSELIFNVVFGLLYISLRSSRGIFMFVLFACKKTLKNTKSAQKTSIRLSESSL